MDFVQEQHGWLFEAIPKRLGFVYDIPSDVSAALQNSFRHDPMPALNAAGESSDHG